MDEPIYLRASKLRDHSVLELGFARNYVSKFDTQMSAWNRPCLNHHGPSSPAGQLRFSPASARSQSRAFSFIRFYPTVNRPWQIQVAKSTLNPVMTVFQLKPTCLFLAFSVSNSFADFSYRSLNFISSSCTSCIRCFREFIEITPSPAIFLDAAIDCCLVADLFFVG